MPDFPLDSTPPITDTPAPNRRKMATVRVATSAGTNATKRPSFATYKRIEPEQLAGAAHRIRYGNCMIPRDEWPAARLGDLDQCRGQPAAREIAQAMQLDPGINQPHHGGGKRRAVAGDDRRLETKSLACRHDGDPVAADIAAQHDHVAGPDLLRLDR